MKIQVKNKHISRFINSSLISVAIIAHQWWRQYWCLYPSFCHFKP